MTTPAFSGVRMGEVLTDPWGHVRAVMRERWDMGTFRSVLRSTGNWYYDFPRSVVEEEYYRLLTEQECLT